MPTPPPLNRRRCLGALAGAVALASGVSARAEAAGPVVAAASDLKFALDTIAADFTRHTGHPLRLSYGSSGNFFRQIVQGAPFELFLSADEDFVYQLAERRLVDGRGALYAVGRLVLYAPAGSPLSLDPALADVKAALDDGRLRRFAIANPAHAPYGRAAQQVLVNTGLWPGIEPRLVLAENVSQAAQFARSGSAQGGLFALSLVLTPGPADTGRHLLLPDALHSPLRQRMVLTRRAGAVARSFYGWLQRDEARAVLRRHGFALPGGG